MSYFRVDPFVWEPEHYQPYWSIETPAPNWWAHIDAAWMIDRRMLPPERDIAILWGWGRHKTATFLNNAITAYACSEPRPEKKSEILALRSSKARAKQPADNVESSSQKGAKKQRRDAIHETGLEHETWHDEADDVPDLSPPRFSFFPTATATATAENTSSVASQQQLIGDHQKQATDIKPKTKKATTKEPKAENPAYHALIRVWSNEYVTRYGSKYCWVFTGRDSDANRVKTWVSACCSNSSMVEERSEVFAVAVRKYFSAVDSKKAFPVGSPPTTRHFTRELPVWMSTTEVSSGSQGSSWADAIKIAERFSND